VFARALSNIFLLAVTFNLQGVEGLVGKPGEPGKEGPPGLEVK